VSGSSDATGTTGRAKQNPLNKLPERAQGLLFTEDLPELDEQVGYRGPIACRAAGITYRQLDYWARTGLVEPSVRPAGGSGTHRLYGCSTPASRFSRSGSRSGSFASAASATSPRSHS
jgi:hypothetical protein